MNIHQITVSGRSTVSTELDRLQGNSAQLILAFGAQRWLQAVADPLTTRFSGAHLLDCTTAGEISSHGVSEDTCVMSASQFESLDVKDALPSLGQGLALLVSCVGQKLLMGGRVEEDVDAVADVLSKGAVLSGFYACGEISPFAGSVAC